MVIRQVLLAFVLLLVAFVLEVGRRIISGDQPTTFFYGNFLWVLLFFSAQPPFLIRPLRKLYKLLASGAGFIAGVVFDSLIGPPLLAVIFAIVKGTQVDSMGLVFAGLALLKITSVWVGYIVSKSVVRIAMAQTHTSSSTSDRKDVSPPV